MSHPIYVPPKTATYTVTPPQYAALLAALHSNKEALNPVVNGNSGSVSYQSVEFSWAYDGTTALLVTIVAVHSWAAKVFGNAAIFDELNKQLISLVV